MGCKRIIVDPGFLKGLHRENVELRQDAIDSIVEEGVKLKTGEVVPLDVIIYATGYSLVRSPPSAVDFPAKGPENRMRQTCSTSRALEGKPYMSTSWSKAARRPTSDVVCLDFPTCFTSWVRTFLHTSVRRCSRTSRRTQRRLRTRVRHLQRRSAGTKLPRVPLGRCSLLSVFI